MTPMCWLLVSGLVFVALDTLVFVLWLPYEYQERKPWCVLPGGACVGCLIHACRRYRALRNRKRALNSVGVTNAELRASGWWWVR